MGQTISMLEEDWGISEDDTYPENNTHTDDNTQYQPKGLLGRLRDWLMGE